MSATPLWEFSAFFIVVSLTCLGLAPAAGGSLPAGHQALPPLSSYPDAPTATDTNGIITTIPVAENPSTPAYDSGNGELYLSAGVSGGTPGNGTVYVVSASTNTVTASVPVGTYPLTPVYDSGNGDLYVSEANSSNVTVISGATNSVVTSIPVGRTPGVVVYDNFSGNLYVANVYSDNVSVISGVTNTVIATIPLLCAPYQPTVVGGSVYVLCEGNVSSGPSYDLVVLSAASNKVIATLTLEPGSGPVAPAYDPGNGLLYLPEVASDLILVISPTTNAILESIRIGPGIPYTTPLTPVYDPATGRLYVAEEGAGNLNVLAGSPGEVVANISVGFVATNPPAYDSGNGDLYLPTLQPLSCSGTCLSDVVVVDPQTDTVVSTIATGEYPSTPAYDRANGELYVPNEASNNVTVIFGGDASAPPYTVTFREVGLLPGTLWRVTSGASTRAALAGGTIEFAGLQNGQYAYRAQVFGFASSGSPSSPVSVQGADVGVTVTYVAPAAPPNNVVLTAWELVAILGSLAVVALAAGVALTVRKGR